MVSTRQVAGRGARAGRWFVLGAVLVTLALCLQLTGTWGRLAAGAAGSTGSISGTVWGAHGPMAGVTVSADDNSLSYAIATTDDQGHYTLTGLDPGNYGVQFAPPAGSGLITQWYPQEVIVGQGNTRRNTNAWLRSEARISGTVTTPEGYYARNTQVCAYPASGVGISGRPGEPGSPIPAADGGAGRALAATTVVTGPSGTAPGTSFGTSVPTTSVPPSQPGYSCVATDNAGRFTTAGLRAGSYHVSFQPSGAGRMQYFDGASGAQGSLPTAVVLADGQHQLGVNAVLQPACGTALGNGCLYRYSNSYCFTAQLIGARKVRFTYQCANTAVEWHASDDQSATTNPVELTFAGDGPYTMSVDATVSSTVVSDSLTFSFASGPTEPTMHPADPYGIVTRPGVEQVQVSWIEPVGTVGPMYDYTATAKPGGATCHWSSGPRACTIKGLSAGVAYTFTVRATNTKGEGPSSAPSSPATPSARRFVDVPVTHAFYDHIEWLAAEQVTTGFADGTYRGSLGVQRQAMAAFLYRMAGSPNGSKPTCPEAPFTDVPVGAPFCGEIAWLKTTGITTGSGGLFNPTASVTRAAMAAFLYRFSGSPNGPSPVCAGPPFSDVIVGSSFCGEIAWLKAKGISTGNVDGTYKPSALVSREAMAAFLHRWILV